LGVRAINRAVVSENTYYAIAGLAGDTPVEDDVGAAVSFVNVGRAAS
jgi:hypothetical protein